MKLHCEGGSDDTFGVYYNGTQGEDYDNCASGEPITFRVTGGPDGESLLVVGQYAPDDCGGWLIGVAPDSDAEIEEDDAEIPAWPMHFERSDRRYSPRLVIDVPEPFTIRHVP